MGKYHIITFGCQMNTSDAERLASILEKSGYQKIEEIKEADLVAIVSCSVRQMAVDRVYGAIKNIRKENKKNKIIVTGCLPATDKKKLAKQADLILEIKDLNKLPKLLKIKKCPDSLLISRNNKTGITTSHQEKLEIGKYLRIKPKYLTFPVGYVPIMTGCNNFCSYCVVPYTRGSEISRPTQEIIDEVKNLIKKNYKEIVLLGQNVNSYQSNNINFPKLLKTINNLTGNFWLTFISSHPKDLSDELIATMSTCEKLMSYLHLPVQAGNDEILHRMNRHYTISHYKDLVRKIRDKFDTINLSTDIIVGFPGETKKQFTDTAKLMREVKFDMAYLAKYSPRPGTAAWTLPNNVSTQEKERRWQTLNAILKKTGLENNKKYLNKIIEVLITESPFSALSPKPESINDKTIEDKQNDYLFGQSKGFKNVKIDRKSAQAESQIPEIGNIVKARIIKVSSWGLEGIFTD
jgi:tRNA-2-methylthio-N6-dimethylallyladenosine synthase